MRQHLTSTDQQSNRFKDVCYVDQGIVPDLVVQWKDYDVTQLMQQGQGAHAEHWKDVAVRQSEVITDAWEVAKVYSGRFAEWILYICMIINVLTVFLSFSPSVSNAVLSIQVVTLDIAGFGLQSMAEGVDKKSAISAHVTSWFLILIMIVTMLLVTGSHLYPQISAYTTIADNILIMVRVIMTVVYGHVVHGLRAASKRKVEATELAKLRALVADIQHATHTQPQPQVQPAIEPTVQPATQNAAQPVTPTRKRTTVKPANRSAKKPANSERIATYRTKHLDATQAQVADALKISVRTVQLYWNTQASEEN